MGVFSHKPESKFVYVIVAARRARQLQVGARPLIETPKAHKSTRIAEEELEKGLLEYELPEVAEPAGEKEGKRRRA